mgnify:CR=1 FL=1|jgi:hypothetical protein
MTCIVFDSLSVWSQMHIGGSIPLQGGAFEVLSMLTCYWRRISMTYDVKYNSIDENSQIEVLRVYIDIEFLSDVPVIINIIDESGKKYGSLSHINHPSFEATRTLLEEKGYLLVERGWCNGDVILRDFYFNDKLLKAGTSFYSAVAMGIRSQFN